MLCSKIWRWDYLKARLQDVMHHKIKLFVSTDSKPTLTGKPPKAPSKSKPSVVESGWVSWLFSSYCEYLAVREECCRFDSLPVRDKGPRPSGIITVLDAFGKPTTVDVRKEVCFQNSSFVVFRRFSSGAVVSVCVE
jgi:hypothetical protein